MDENTRELPLVPDPPDPSPLTGEAPDLPPEAVPATPASPECLPDPPQESMNRSPDDPEPDPRVLSDDTAEIPVVGAQAPQTRAAPRRALGITASAAVAVMLLAGTYVVTRQHMDLAPAVSPSPSHAVAARPAPPPPLPSPSGRPATSTASTAPPTSASPSPPMPSATPAPSGAAALSAVKTQALSQLAAARQSLAASPQAGTSEKADAQTAITRLQLVTDQLGLTTSAADLADASAKLTTAISALDASQAAWAKDQARQQARQAKEAKAQQKAAEAEADRARRIAGSDHKCQPSPSGTFLDFGNNTLAAAINGYRQAHGVKPLTYGVSKVMASQAGDMAVAGTVWAGKASVTACDRSVDGLLATWQASPAQAAQLLRADATYMSISVVSGSGMLYAAVQLS